jgi:hypothetical protein
MGKTSAFAINGRKITGIKCATAKGGEFEVDSREGASRKLAIRKMLTANFFFFKNFIFIMHRGLTNPSIISLHKTSLVGRLVFAGIVG